MIIGQDEFKRLLFGDAKGNYVRFATIASGYISGRPTLIFDGESTATIKQYPYISSYTPTAGDRVMVVNGVIIGNIL